VLHYVLRTARYKAASCKCGKAVEQTDCYDAILRQALEALNRAHQTTMYQTLKARIPECGEFAGIAQDLDFAIAELRK
jgi:hypothetical protein